jgi:hypothetical protein
MPSPYPAKSALSAGGFRVGWSWARRLALVCAVIAAFALAIALKLPVCPTATFLGVPCPGCGLTRATLRLLQGDFAGALSLHPLAPAIAPLLVALGVKAALDYVGFTRRTPGPPSPRAARWTNVFAVTLLCALVGVWGARFFGAFGGPVPVSSPGRALIERALGHERSKAPNGSRTDGGVSSASWPRSTR